MGFLSTKKPAVSMRANVRLVPAASVEDLKKFEEDNDVPVAALVSAHCPRWVFDDFGFNATFTASRRTAMNELPKLVEDFKLSVKIRDDGAEKCAESWAATLRKWPGLKDFLLFEIVESVPNEEAHFRLMKAANRNLEKKADEHAENLEGVAHNVSLGMDLNERANEEVLAKLERVTNICLESAQKQDRAELQIQEMSEELQELRQLKEERAIAAEADPPAQAVGVLAINDEQAPFPAAWKSKLSRRTHDLIPT